MTYCYHCSCGHRTNTRTRTAPTCECGKPMKRDWKAESVQVAYHPTKGRA